MSGRTEPGGGRPDERGAALLLVLFALVVAWTAALLFALALAIELRSAREDQRRLRLTLLADAALAEALAALALDPYSTGVAWQEFGGGEIGAEIGGIDDLERTVVARARSGGAERTVVATVVVSAWGPTVAAWRSLGTRPIGEDDPGAE